MIALVTADKYFIDDITYRLRDMDIEPREFYSTVAGEATYALSQDERDKTAMLIDIGYLCTDVMVMEGDALISTSASTLAAVIFRRTLRSS